MLTRCPLGVTLCAQTLAATLMLGAAASAQPVPGSASAATPEPSAGPLSAEEIFERARDVWTGQRYPERLSYVVAVRVRQNGRELQNHYRGECTANGEMHVYAFSDEETARPYVSRGFDFYLTLTLTKGGSTTLSRKISALPPPTDYLGVPVVQPAYSFGLARTAATASGSSGSDELTRLRTIGRVASHQRTYDVSLTGTQTYQGAPAYHLALRPLRDPKRNRIREMWVDTDTFATRKIVTEGNFTAGPPLRATWSTTFHQIDGAQYIETESADGVLDYGQGRRYAGATLSFEAIQPAASRFTTALSMTQPARETDLREP